MRFNKLCFTGTREQQLASARASGYTVVAYKRAPVIVAFKAMAGKTFVKAWRDNCHRVAFYYAFNKPESAREYVERFVDNVARVRGTKADWKRERAEKRAALRASDHYAVGDVLYNSWGYDQTNVDFYQVTHVGAKTIKIRPVKVNYRETGFMQGINQPRRFEFCGDELTKPLSVDGGISARHGCFSKWDGRAVWSSSYA
jgi:hypothetical protein